MKFKRVYFLIQDKERVDYTVVGNTAIGHRIMFPLTGTRIFIKPTERYNKQAHTIEAVSPIIVGALGEV